MTLVVVTKDDASIGRVIVDKAGTSLTDAEKNFKVPAEVYERIKDALIATQIEVNAHLADTTDAHAASAITNTPTGGIAATTVQGAINELKTSVDAHLADTTDAHVASSIGNTPTGGIVATTVQAAINELKTNADAHLADTTDAHVASSIGNTPAGNIAATNVQTALNELDTEKAKLSGGNAFSGAQTVSGSDEFLYSAARSKVVRIAALPMNRSTSNYSYSAGEAITAVIANAFAWMSLSPYLNTGDVITRIKVTCKPGTAEGTLANKCHLTLYEITPDFTTPAANASSAGSPVFDVPDNGTTNIQVIDSGAISVTVNKATKDIYLSFEATNTVGAGTILYAIEITRDVLGPRTW